MPIYNGGKYLYYSLRSIQNQKIKEIEIVLIDDCSTDDSLNIIEKYMEEDPRIK
jgi:glycosyltransferase involved in cell wall biosynthesis